MSVTKKLQIDLPNGRHGSMQNPNPDGVKLPPIPMSMALAVALEVEASRNLRSPRDQAMVILEVHFKLKRSSLLRLVQESEDGSLEPARPILISKEVANALEERGATVLDFPEPQDAWDMAFGESATEAERQFVRRMKAMHVTAQAGREILEAIILLETVDKDVLTEAMKMLHSAHPA